MKKKLFFAVFLVVIFLLFIGYKYLSISASANEGVLKIVSSPTTSVFLNSAAIGRTPYENKIKAGEYIVKLIPEGIATEAASWQGKVTISKNTLTYIDRELGTSENTSGGVVFTLSKMIDKPKSNNLGEVVIDSEPIGAIVKFDGDEKGNTPLKLQDVIEGEHELFVSLPGFFPRSHKVKIEAGFALNAQIKLPINPGYKSLLDIAKDSNATNSATITPSIGPQTTGSPLPTESAEDNSFYVTIKSTSTGWLRVRTEPSLYASEAAKVNPGEKYRVVESQSGWYKINYKENLTGWVAAQYTQKID